MSCRIHWFEFALRPPTVNYHTLKNMHYKGWFATVGIISVCYVPSCICQYDIIDKMLTFINKKFRADYKVKL